MPIQTLSGKRIQQSIQESIARSASNNLATANEDIDWQGALNGVIKKDDNLGWFGLIPFLFSGVKGDDDGSWGKPEGGVRGFLLTAEEVREEWDREQREQSGKSGQTGSTTSAYRLEARVPEGAINPMVLNGIDYDAHDINTGLSIGEGYTYLTPFNLLRRFATLAELENHIKSYQAANPDYRAPVLALGGLVSNATIPVRYETALGDTVVVIPSGNIFDATGNVAAKAYQFNAHLAGQKKLPSGDFSRYTVQYYFNPDGSFKGIAVERSTLRTRPHNYIDPVEKSTHYQDTLTTDRVASFGEPGQPLEAAKRGKFVEVLRTKLFLSQPVVAELALPENVAEGFSLPPTGGTLKGSATGPTQPDKSGNYTDAQLQNAVAAALRDWFSMEPDVRREIGHLVGIQNDRALVSDEPVLDRDRIESDWVTSRAMAHLEGRGETIFDVKLTKRGLEVTNAGLVFNDGRDNYDLDEVFTLGSTGEGFPSEFFVNTVADALQGRVALTDIPRDQLILAIKRTFAERGYHNDNVFGPGYKHKSSRPTIPVTVNGRAMELQTDSIESNVRDILFTPIRTRIERFRDAVKDLFGMRLRIGNVQATEYIPRAQLPELAMGTNGNLREFKTLPEFLTEVHRRFGAPTRVLSDPSEFPMYGRALEQLSEWEGTSVGLYAIKPGQGIKGFIEWIGGLHRSLGQIDFPMGYFSHIARVRGDLYNGRGELAVVDTGKPHPPYTAHDVYYFFDRLGNLASSMVVARDESSRVPARARARVALRMDTPAVTGHVSYEQIKFKELVAKAMESFRDGDIGRAYDAFARLASGIGQLQEYTDSPSVAMTLKRLKAAAHEAAGDMAELRGRPDPLSYGRALSTAVQLGLTEFDSLKARVDEAKSEGGREVIEQIWTEMGSDRLFRDPLAALEGGTITPEEMARPAVDISAPIFNGADAAIRTERMLRTRSEILRAHRETLRAAERVEKR